MKISRTGQSEFLEEIKKIAFPVDSPYEDGPKEIEGVPEGEQFGEDENDPVRKLDRVISRIQASNKQDLPGENVQEILRNVEIDLLEIKSLLEKDTGEEDMVEMPPLEEDLDRIPF